MQLHITVATRGRLPAFPSLSHRRRAVRAIVRTFGSACPLFCVADDHAHAVVTCERGRGPRLAANFSQALRFVSAHPLEPTRVKEVASRSHLETLVAYVLDQSTHHRLATATHQALWEGSSFLDLVGARLLRGFTPGTLREILPRTSAVEVYGAVGLVPLEPADDTALATLGAVALVEAACTCLAVDSLAGKAPHVVGARRVVAHLADRVGVRPNHVAQALGVSSRTVWRAGVLPADARFERGIRLWIAIRGAVDAVRTSPTG